MSQGASGVYRPRHPRASPLWLCAHGHFGEFLADYETRYRPEYGFLRPAIPDAVAGGGVLSRAVADTLGGPHGSRPQGRRKQIPIVNPLFTCQLCIKSGSCADLKKTAGLVPPFFTYSINSFREFTTSLSC